MKVTIMVLIVLSAVVTGCANEAPLGQSVAQMKAEQRYNPDAASQNEGYVPEANGERMEKTYSLYIDKTTDKMSGSSSRVLDGQ